MGHKGSRNRAGKGATACPEIDRLLSSCAERLDTMNPVPGLKEALSGYPGWLPYLVRRLATGSAPERKAAVLALFRSDTASGIDAVTGLARDEKAPAWLRRFAVELLGDAAPVEARDEIVRWSRVLSTAVLAEEDARELRGRLQLLVDDSRADDLVGLFGSGAMVNDEVVRAVVEHETAAAGHVLVRLQCRELGKAEEKIVRKAVHGLRQRGVAIDDPATVRVEATAVTPVATLAYGSHVDGEGSRLLFLACGKPREEGFDFLQFMLNDQRGLVSFSRGWLSRKELDGVIARIESEDERLRLVTLEPSWAWHLVREAYGTSRRVANVIPEQWVRERHMWEQAAPAAGLVSEARAALSADALAGPSGSEVALVESPEIASWAPTQRELGELLDRYMDVEDSPIVTTQEMKVGRQDEIVAEGTRRLFGGAARPRMARRFEEMAVYFLKLGRQDEAVLALRASDAVSASDDEAPSPVLVRLVGRALAAAAAELKERAEESLVARPGARARR